MKKQINEIKRMKQLAGLKENLQNDDMIYDHMLTVDHEYLVSDMISAAEGDPSLTLIDYLKKFDYSDEI